MGETVKKTRIRELLRYYSTLRNNHEALLDGNLSRKTKKEEQIQSVIDECHAKESVLETLLEDGEVTEWKQS